MASRQDVTGAAGRHDGFAPIGDYAVISDQRTAALVARDGSIDWMCAPRFDSPPLLNRLLDPQRGGALELAPSGSSTAQREYVEDTNVLQTTWTTARGVLRVTDALVITSGIQRFSQLVRRVECLAGEVELDWSARPRVGWDAVAPRLRVVGEGHVFTHRKLEMLVQAHGLGECREGEGEVAARVGLGEGESGLLSILFTHDFPLLATSRDGCEQRLEETIAFWRAWLHPLRYDGPWSGAVRRSALVLGACMHDQTGAMVASPTTSLPERIGGPRNFDYRYCWVRDTTFALDAALRLGMTQFAQATLGWLLRSERHTHPRINVFFTLDGDPLMPQHQIDVPGYRGSTPVLEGNHAGRQLQLGCFGDLLETAWLFVRSGSHLDQTSGLHLAEVADFLCESWRNPDSGIWELGDKRDYTHSKLSCWNALDRAAALADAGELVRAHPRRWRAARDDIGRWTDAHCWAADGTLLRDGDGSGELDCAVLLAPRSDHIDAGDPRFEQTMRRIADELGAGGPLLYRYSGMREEENAFLPCSFWMAEALTRSGRLDDAAGMLDELVGLTNDVGLMSEEMDPADHSLLGNFPLCLTHLALLNAAAIHAGQSAHDPDEVTAD